VIDEGGHFKRLRADHISVADAARDDEAANVVVADPALETPIFGVFARRVIAVAADDD